MSYGKKITKWERDWLMLDSDLEEMTDNIPKGHWVVLNACVPRVVPPNNFRRYNGAKGRRWRLGWDYMMVSGTRVHKLDPMFKNEPAEVMIVRPHVASLMARMPPGQRWAPPFNLKVRLIPAQFRYFFLNCFTNTRQPHSEDDTDGESKRPNSNLNSFESLDCGPTPSKRKCPAKETTDSPTSEQENARPAAAAKPPGTPGFVKNCTYSPLLHT